MEIRRYLSLLALTFLLAARGYGEDAADENYRFPREQRDLELQEVAEGFSLGFGATASAFRESANSVTSERATFEGMDLELEISLSEVFSVEADLEYDHEGKRDVSFEEIFGKIEWEGEATWTLELGQMELPMGEYNSNFVEDPSTVVIGETFDRAIVLGYETEHFELAVAGYQGDFSGKNFVAALNFTGIENLEMGFFASDSIGESLELRDFQREAIEEDEDGELLVRQVAGYGAFFALEMDPFIFDFEWITASKAFAPGLLGDEAKKPQAWNIELSASPAPRWQVGVRLERSKDVPDSPKHQYGVALSYGISEHLMLTGNYLRGEFEEDNLKRDLLQLELVFEF